MSEFRARIVRVRKKATDPGFIARCIATLATSVEAYTDDRIDEADLLAYFIETGKRPVIRNPEAEAMIDNCIDAARKKRNGEAA